MWPDSIPATRGGPERAPCSSSPKCRRAGRGAPGLGAVGFLTGVLCVLAVVGDGGGQPVDGVFDASDETDGVAGVQFGADEADHGADVGDEDA